MDSTAIIVSAVRNMAASVSAILGTPALETLITVNGTTVLHEKNER